MMLDRPARPPAGAVTDRVRRVILAAAERQRISWTSLLSRHAQAEHIGGWDDLIADVEERYELPTGSLAEQVQAPRSRAADVNGLISVTARSELPAESILYALPDAEFLTVLEHAVGDSPPPYVMTSAAADLLTTADDVLRVGVDAWTGPTVDI